MNKELLLKILKIIVNILDKILEEVDERGGAENEPKNEAETTETVQACIFPMDYLRVTQGRNIGTHRGSKAVDFGGKDQGKDVLYAPCDMRVIRVRKNANGELYTESTKPVKLADGSTDYARFLFLHDPQAEVNWEKGDIILKGDGFYREGGMGAGNPNKFRAHVHIEAGKGKWNTETPLHYRTDERDDDGNYTYSIENPANLEDIFYISNETKILEKGGYSWKNISSQVL